MRERNRKVKTIPEMAGIAGRLRSEGRRLVLANGCFDIIHVGHIRYLEGARAAGDLLLVAVNGDRSVRALKGDGRPLMPADERAEIVASFGCVNYVIIFDEPTVDHVLTRIQPAVHAKGTDYTPESVPERETVRSYGGEVAIVGDRKCHATRNIIDIIVRRFSARTCGG
ncbi:ADP-heptose synthase [candidate division TA06 bacterium DG_24]|uniref:ADP-heptose synthase n=2 Tax=Bacteria division TA06 TaxID=1156500 RepID=A0A0S8G9N7_UNCT6|nr:MAG: ADP-heptose synthase [candidate division TA06 bacterium DG_24]KPK69799.1 MAG: ADP-heptose synthase [candidate division TA06 bacterium SM23_40]